MFHVNLCLMSKVQKEKIGARGTAGQSGALDRYSYRGLQISSQHPPHNHLSSLHASVIHMVNIYTHKHSHTETNLFKI